MKNDRGFKIGSRLIVKNRVSIFRGRRGAVILLKMTGVIADLDGEGGKSLFFSYLDIQPEDAVSQLGRIAT